MGAVATRSVIDLTLEVTTEVLMMKLSLMVEGKTAGVVAERGVSRPNP